MLSPYDETVFNDYSRLIPGASGAHVTCVLHLCFRMRRIVSACGDSFSACGGPSPHAEIGVPRAENRFRMRRLVFRMRRSVFRMRRNVSAYVTGLRMRRVSSARTIRVSACGEGPPHAEHESPHAESVLRTRNTGGPPHAETVLRTRKTSLRMRKRFSACGNNSPHAEAHVMRKTMRKVPFSASVLLSWMMLDPRLLYLT